MAPRWITEDHIAHMAATPTFDMLLRKLEEAVAVSGVFAGVLEKIPGKLLENFSRIVKCYKFWDFGHRERQTCREPWVHTARDLVPTFQVGCFLKSTVPAFSSFSELQKASHAAVH